MSGIENRGLVIAGVGAGSLDLFPEYVMFDGHEPGGKTLLTTDQIGVIEANIEDLEGHIGGNAVNSLAWVAAQESVDLSSLITVLGDDDTASSAIRSHLPQVGITTDRIVTTPGYLPSIASIEQAGPGSDRMVRSRPRGPMGEYMSDAFLKSSMFDADVVLAASLKDTALMERVFTLAPEETFLTFNPSMTEIDDPKSRADMLRIMSGRNADLLAANETEIPKLQSAYHAGISLGEVTKLAEGTSELYAKYVLCTLGKHGLLLASNGDSVYRPIVEVPEEEMGTTLGAGDRAHAIAALRLKQGVAPMDILDEIAHSTAQLVRTKGAHQDMYNQAA
jgi:sugar/nucleoside kinase (ribokinase family)